MGSRRPLDCHTHTFNELVVRRRLPDAYVPPALQAYALRDPDRLHLDPAGAASARRG
jgi:hypothetical protein